MSYHYTNEINKDKKFFTFYGKTQDYFFPILWCLLWFVWNPIYLPQFRYIVAGVEGVLIIIGIINILLKKYAIKFNLILWVILFGIFIELLNGNFSSAIIRDFFFGLRVYNLCLILILLFYITSYKKLIQFIRIFLIFIFFTIILVGFYHLIASSPIFDFYKSELGGFYFEKKRLTGLIYSCANDAASVIVIFIGFFISFTLLKIYRNKLTFFLLIIGILAVVLSFTRAAWLGVLFIFIFSYFINPIKKKKINFLNVSLSILLVISIFVYYNLINLSQHIDRLENISLSAHSGRIQLFSIFFQNVKDVILGNGLYSSPSGDFFQISKMYITVHNQFMDYVLIFGIPFTLFILYSIFSQLIKLLHIIKSNDIALSIRSVGLGLFSAQIGYIISAMFNSNRYFYIFLLYMLIDFYLRTTEVENNKLKFNDLNKKFKFNYVR